MYIIKSKSTNEYWSNEFGWIEYIDDATIFTEEEQDTFNLVIGNQAEWVKFDPYNIGDIDNEN